MSTTAPASWTGLVEGLTTEGVLSEQWRSAFLAVPREVFIPEVIWRCAGDDLIPLRRADDPHEWLRRAYGPRYVITQVDDGTPAGPGERGQLATSSASRPDIVALMLDAAHLTPGMRVLEIGTGTGYTAALLAHRLGPRNVTTIEIDPTLAAQARTALSTAGYGQVTVLTGDGTYGHRQGAPFDRVLSTVAAPRVPYEWIAHTRPGGLVVTPWSSAYKPAGLLSLTVGSDGTATGSLINKTISFMPLRDQRVHRAAITEIVRDTDHSQLTHTSLHAHHVYAHDAPFAIGWHVPDCHRHYLPPTSDDDHWHVWFLDSTSRSWARFDYHPDTQHWPVHQFGPRRLWDEIHAAYQHWDHAGRPPAEQWTITITPHDRHLNMATTPIRTPPNPTVATPM